MLRTSKISLVSMLFATFVLCGVAARPACAEGEPLKLKLRSQTEVAPGTARFHTKEMPAEWNPAETAVILCDVWDYHHCLNAVRRLEEFGPRLNDLVAKARSQGCTIIHAPSDCMPQYTEHPARARAIAAPKAPNQPPEIQRWCSIVPSEKQAIYPLDQSDGGEDDDPKEHAEWAAKLTALGRNPKLPWKKQSDMIKIDDARDFISDKGDEVWNVLESRGIKNVILAGVHLNMCVLGRPFGLRRMIEGGKNAVLVRDLTDTMYNPKMWPYVPHFTGTDRMVAHVEQRVCPTISSDQILGDGKPFRHAADKRPHIAVVIAEEGYKTIETLPDFADRYLGDFRVSYVYGNVPREGDKTPTDIPGLEVLEEADAVILSVRRKALKPEQMAIVRRFVAAKKPVIGIRTSSHAFALRDGVKTPEGYEAWPTFDVDVFGAQYRGDFQTKPTTTIGEGRLSVEGQSVEPPVDDTKQTDRLFAGLAGRTFSRSGDIYNFKFVPGASLYSRAWMAHPGTHGEPVGWAFRRKDGGLSFLASLGSLSDFNSPVFVRLLFNAAYWAVDRDPPTELPNLSRREELQRHWTMIDVPGPLDPLITSAMGTHSASGWIRCIVRIPSTWKKDQVSLEVLDPHAAIWFNGVPVVGRFGGSVEPSAVHVGEANLIVVRTPDWQSAALLKAPVLKHGEDSIWLAGKWRFRIGNDESWSNMPLPARFGAATDYIIEPTAK
jgi:nicotinamidase-related amidase